MKDLSVIIPSFHSKDLTLLCLKGFEKFKPSDLNIVYIVVENSDDISYKNEVISIADNVIWINNVTKAVGSYANAEGIIVGLEKVESEWVFLCHCDIFVTSNLFFEELSKKEEEGYKMVGTGLDLTRIHACHISGVFVTTEIARAVDMYPVGGVGYMDVGDDITRYCRDEDIKYCCLENTYNSFKEDGLADDRYKGFVVNRSVNSNGEVLFMHLGRGIPKTEGIYKKEGRVYFEDWIDFCNGVLDD